MSSMHNPAHPGEVLREYLPEGLGISDAAKRLGVTRQALSALINGRAGVSASMALRLEAEASLHPLVSPLHRLLNPKLIHSDERIRIVGLKPCPVAQIDGGRVIGKPHAVLVQHSGIQLETDELEPDSG